MKAILCWQNAVLTEVDVQGHAQISDICVAVSFLLRSSAQALQNLQTSGHLEWELDLPSEGRFVWSLCSWSDGLQGPLQGVSLVLASGLRRLAGDYISLELFEEDLTI